MLCSRLDLAGGIERAVVSTANLFAGKGNKVTLLILDETSDSFYPISGSINIIQQPLSFGITREGNPITRKIRLLSDVLKLRRMLKQLKPTVVITSEYPFSCATVLCGQKKRSKIISWEHHHFYELKRNNFWERMVRSAYPKLNGLVCLNEDEQKLFASFNPNRAVIPNFVAAGNSRSTLNNKTILTIARLVPVKGIDLLLQTAKLVLDKHPGWKWKLIGDGEMKAIVDDFIEKENLQDKLLLQAPVDPDIKAEYLNASMYIMSSRNECFPMTLLEAQSAGLPCISFDCDTGPRHIIIDKENGLLVEKENPGKLAEAVSSLILDEEKRKQMGKAAFESVQRFSPENVYALWEKIIT